MLSVKEIVYIGPLLIYLDTVHVGHSHIHNSYHTVHMYMYLGSYYAPLRGLWPGHKAWPHQKITTTTAPAFPCAFFLGVIKETYNTDSTISIYLKEIFFYLHLLPEKHNPIRNTRLVPIEYG